MKTCPHTEVGDIPTPLPQKAGSGYHEYTTSFELGIVRIGVFYF